MTPGTLKLAITVTCLLIMMIGAAVMISFMQDGAGSVGMTVGALMILAPASVIMTRLPKLWRCQLMDQDWYQNTYPDSVNGGQIACYECGSERVQAHDRRLPFGHQGHVCGRCDTTLFYS